MKARKPRILPAAGRIDAPKPFHLAGKAEVFDKRFTPQNLGDIYAYILGPEWGKK